MNTFSTMITAACLLGTTISFSGTAGAGDDDRDFMQAREAVYPALVNISVVGKQYQNGRMRRFPAAGSGVIVSPEGHVLTNFHVAGETTRITCKLPDGRVFNAEPIVLDPLTDLAVLQLQLEQDGTTEEVPFARLGDSDQLEIGDDVFAMGNPQTLSSSMTRGIVSNPTRVFTSFTGNEMDEVDLGGGQRTGLFTRWIQHDALILGGNSGGPLVNLEGEVVGINDRGGSGMSFAIPSNLADDVLRQAVEKGFVERGWMGLSVKPVDKINRDSGALVTWVVEGSPAEQAGLKAGDIITNMDGEPIRIRSFEEIPPLLKRMADIKPGSPAPIDWERDGKPMHGTLVSEPLEEYLGQEDEAKNWGITVRDVTAQMALGLRFPSAEGVMVTGVRPGKPAEKAQPQIARGDVILNVDGTPVENLEDFIREIRELEEGQESLVTFRRGDAEILTVIETEAERNVIGGGELPRAWLGAETQVLTKPVAKAIGLESTRGFRVTRIYPGTEAEAAGLRIGDVITAIEGGKLRASRPQDAAQLTRRIENLPVETEAAFDIIRDGKEMKLPIMMEPTPSSVSDTESAESEILEFSVRDPIFMDAIDKRWEDAVRGVVVTNVTPGGWASLGGLQQGDLLISINDKDVADVAGFEQQIESIMTQRPKIVKIFVLRDHRTNFIFIEPDWPEPEDAI
ncbi:MAG: PDZ domain-containing protein [Phycisphaerales bacterium]|nr:PDZ domain-containing protein [Phycisphaerales bacterium]